MPRHNDPPCPCQSGRSYERCCGPFIRGDETPPTAEALMRSRYSAYARMDEDYLQATWHASTRPQSIDLTSGATANWIGLRVMRHETEGVDAATVEFIARYRVDGRAHRLHETSRFVREAGRWFYVEGLVHPDRNR